jgi:hypothetical protein
MGKHVSESRKKVHKKRAPTSIVLTASEPDSPVTHTFGLFRAHADMSPAAIECMTSLFRWYTVDIIAAVLMPVIRKTSVVSLRVLEWLVTNFAKQHRVVFQNDNGLIPSFNIYDDYTRMRNRWKRRSFDPFRRRKQNVMDVYFTFENQTYVTTVAQLNFLKWSVTKSVLLYAELHRTSIEKHMVDTMTRARQTKNTAKRLGLTYKRSELSKSPKGACFVYSAPIRVHIGLYRIGRQ